jgi:molecular chaperone DnaK (HSP70)
MAKEARPALGLSIGATNLAAVTANHAITRKPVLTLYRQRPPEVGVPSENPRLDEPGLVITDFVDKVGDPTGIVASDGSMHRSEALVADGLRALAYAATGGRALPESVAVTYPAHWSPKAVDSLGSALSGVSEWSSRARPLTVIPDAAATLFAARANPGIPARGMVAVCDFGGTGTSITLIDADGDYQPLGPTVRHHDFSGDLIDQALLTSVMDNLASTASFDPTGTSAIGSLTRLRSRCRSAKEQLSMSTVTMLTEELAGLRDDIRITRNELDEAIRDSLNGFLAALEETLARNGVRGSDLAAVISVGGGANIPAVTTALSGRLRVPVVTTPRPQLTAGIGGALRAARGPADTSATAPPAPKLSGPPESARPALKFEHEHEERPRQEPKAQVIPWYRLPAVVIIGAAVAMLVVGTAVAIALSSSDKPATTPAPGVSATPAAPATPGSEAPAPAGSATPQPGPAPSQQPETQQAPPPQATETP